MAGRFRLVAVCVVLGVCAVHGLGLAAAYVPGQVLVRFRSDAAPPAALRAGGVDLLVQPRRPYAAVHRAVVPTGSDLRSVLRDLRVDPRVLYAEPNYIARVLVVPNDTRVSEQWALTSISAFAGWDIETGIGVPVSVAVVDTGTDADHEDLAGHVAGGYDFVNGDADPDDDNGHGTHVSGTVAALTNNSKGIAGVSWGATVMPVKVLDADGSGPYDTVAEGVRYAADHGAAVINMSLGGDYYSETLRDAVDYAWANGVVIVGAAGNESTSAPTYPAAYERVVAVSALGPDDSPAWFSNYGSYVDLAAPGVNILSTVPPWLGNYDGSWSGTSMAAPHVSGLAALVIAHNSSLSNQAVENILEQTAVDLGNEGRDDYYGWGKIDVRAALEAAEPGPEGSVLINDGDTYTDTPSVWLTLSASRATEMMISNAPTFDGAGWEPFAATRLWTLGEGDGTKTVYAKFRDAQGRESPVASDDITVDTIPPAAPVITSPPEGGETADLFVAVEGEAEDQALVTIWDDGQAIANVTAVGGHFHATNAFALGPHEVSAIAQDQAGNLSPRSLPVHFTVLEQQGEYWHHTGHLPGASNINAIAVHPMDNHIVYCGAWDGLYWSQDQGATWQRIFPNSGVISVSIAAGSPESILVGTFEDGVLWSGDGGATWAPSSAGLVATDGTIPSGVMVSFSASDPAVAYAGTRYGTTGGVYKSLDGGRSWQRLSSYPQGQSNIVAVDPATPDIVYSGGTWGGLYRSTDGGMSWASVLAGGVWHIAVDPQRAPVVYVGTWGGGVYKSTDRGLTWSQKNNGLFGYELTNTGPFAICSDAPDTLYVPIASGETWTGRLFRSTDGGESWFVADTGLDSPYVRALAVDPADDSVAHVGTWGRGMFTTANGGAEWASVQSGFVDEAYIYGFSGDPGNADLVYAATGSGVFGSSDGGQDWATGTRGASSPLTFAVVWDGDAVFAGTQHGVMASFDGGGTWQSKSNGLPQDAAPGSTAEVHAIAIRPDDRNRIYASIGVLPHGGGGVYRTVDRGGTWQAMGLGGLSTGPLILDPGTPDVMYAGLLSWDGEAGVLKTTDGGQTWQPSSAGLPAAAVLSLLLASDASLYAGTGNGVYKSTNGAATWQAANEGLLTSLVRVYGLAADPDDPQALYAATSAGAFRSANGGHQWRPLNAGLGPSATEAAHSLDGQAPLTRAVALIAGRLYAGTWGLGAFQAEQDFAAPAAPMITAVSLAGNIAHIGGIAEPYSTVRVYDQSYGTTALSALYETGANGTFDAFLRLPPGVHRLASVSIDRATNASDLSLWHDALSVPRFSDVPPGSFGFAEIEACVRAGIVRGYPGGSYRPDVPVTRADMAVFIARALAGGETLVPSGPSEPSFFDVSQDYWAYRYVEYCAARGIVRGYWDGTYRPDEVVNRGAMAVYVSRAVAGGDEAVPDDTDGATFPDVTDTDDWAWCYDYVEYCAANEVVQGHWDGTYRPGNEVTRAQMAVYVQRAFELPM